MSDEKETYVGPIEQEITLPILEKISFNWELVML